MSKSNYAQGLSQSSTHFSAAPVTDAEFSRFTSNPRHWTTFNGGDIVPIYCAEVLPNDTFSVDVDFVVRQTTLLTPTMDDLTIQVFAFFVPNRVVNRSWKQLMGENLSGSWTAPEITLAPLYMGDQSSVTIPIGSVADYYGLPTQQAIPSSLLTQMHDLKFRGYIEIYNQYFRDENYQPPINYSKLNIYQGFLEDEATLIGAFASVSSSRYYDGGGTQYAMSSEVTGGSFYAYGKQPSSDYSYPENSVDGSYAAGAINHALFGDGEPNIYYGTGSAADSARMNARYTDWSALNSPLKANKFHDYFTSVLPSPQKGGDIVFSLASTASVTGSFTLPQVTLDTSSSVSSFSQYALYLRANGSPTDGSHVLQISTNSTLYPDGDGAVGYVAATSSSATSNTILGSNLVTSASTIDISSSDGLYADLSGATGVSISDLRTGFALQHLYEQMARAGSRYREYCKAFFGIDTDDPYSDIPQYLGKITRNLDMYQTAQTSASSSDGTAQGNLAAFGYTHTRGELFHKTFVEHGYVHIFAVVRHRNVYPSFVARDWFRRTQLDYYAPPLSGISEQPVYSREINPFCDDPDGVFGYQEAWAEYRYDPDYVTGYLRPGISGSLSLWDYADDFDSGLQIADGDWLKSNTQDVVDRTLAVSSSLAPQFKGLFSFHVTKQRAMPIYDIPGLADL